jgi:hypothetical protein
MAEARIGFSESTSEFKTMPEFAEIRAWLLRYAAVRGVPSYLRLSRSEIAFASFWAGKGGEPEPVAKEWQEASARWEKARR